MQIWLAAFSAASYKFVGMRTEDLIINIKRTAMIDLRLEKEAIFRTSHYSVRVLIELWKNAATRLSLLLKDSASSWKSA